MNRNRLTSVEDGNWTVYGVDFSKESDTVNECLKRLMEYEETGASPEFIESLPNMLEDVKSILMDKNTHSYDRINKAVALIDFINKRFKV